jgi:hypothetical protein
LDGVPTNGLFGAKSGTLKQFVIVSYASSRFTFVLGSSAPALHDGSDRTPAIMIHQNVRKAGYVAYGTW